MTFLTMQIRTTIFLFLAILFVSNSSEARLIRIEEYPVSKEKKFLQNSDAVSSELTKVAQEEALKDCQRAVIGNQRCLIAPTVKISPEYQEQSPKFLDYKHGKITVQATAWRVIDIKNDTVPVDARGFCQFHLIPALRAYTTYKNIGKAKIVKGEFKSKYNDPDDPNADPEIALEKAQKETDIHAIEEGFDPDDCKKIGSSDVIEDPIYDYKRDRDDALHATLIGMAYGAKITSVCQKRENIVHTELLPVNELHSLTCAGINSCLQFYSKEQAPLSMVERLQSIYRTKFCEGVNIENGNDNYTDFMEAR